MTSGRAFRSLRTQGEALARLRYDFWQLFGTRWYRTTTQYIYSKDYAHAHASVALEMECCRRGLFFVFDSCGCDTALCGCGCGRSRSDSTTPYALSEVKPLY